MRESRSYGSVGERGGNEPLYPEVKYYTDEKKYTFIFLPGADADPSFPVRAIQEQRNKYGNGHTIQFADPGYE